MPRPRTCSDEDILAAVGLLLGQKGAAGLTLAAVGRQVRLSPATLLQRFGSKKKLLQAFADTAAEHARTPLRAAREAHPSVLWAIQQGLRAMRLHNGDTAPVAQGIAALRQAPNDPDLADAVARYTRGVRDELDELLRAGVETGELLPCDTRGLAEAAYALWTGALLNAPLLSPDQDPIQSAERALNALLLPYRRPVFTHTQR